MCQTIVCQRPRRRRALECSVVIDTIEQLNRDLTIVVIAHRPTTVRRCDRLVELIDGRAVKYGSYEEMLERSPCARTVVEVS